MQKSKSRCLCERRRGREGFVWTGSAGQVSHDLAEEEHTVLGPWLLGTLLDPRHGYSSWGVWQNCADPLAEVRTREDRCLFPISFHGTGTQHPPTKRKKNRIHQDPSRRAAHQVKMGQSQAWGTDGSYINLTHSV